MLLMCACFTNSGGGGKTRASERMESISDFRVSGFGTLMAVLPVARVALPSQKNAPATSVVRALLPLGGKPRPELAKAAGLVAVGQNLARSVKRRYGVRRRFQVG